MIVFRFLEIVCEILETCEQMAVVGSMLRENEIHQVH